MKFTWAACSHFVIYLLWIAFSQLVHGLQLEILPGDMRCIGQELDQLENVVFALGASSYAGISDSKQRVTATVTDPDDETIFEKSLRVGGKVKELEHVVEARGVYEMCFELEGGRTPVRIFFHVDYKPLSPDGKDLSRKIGKDDVLTLESQLQLMKDRIKEISDEIEHARSQEIAMKKAGESTSTGVQWFSILSIVVLVSTSLWQLVYLRRFFASKKLL